MECDNLDINNIQDITEKYDNPDITINNKIDEDHIDKDAVLKNYIDSIDANSDEGLDNIDRDTIQLTINDTSPSVNNIDTLITKDNINEEQLNMNNESKGKSEPSSPLDSPRNNLEKEELLQNKIWPLNRFCQFLLQDLKSPAWEERHGAATGIN